jgi:hypothetical protein
MPGPAQTVGKRREGDESARRDLVDNPLLPYHFVRVSANKAALALYQLVGERAAPLGLRERPVQPDPPVALSVRQTLKA